MTTLNIAELCRLCVNPSYYYANVFQTRSLEGNSLFETLNAICQLNIVEDDYLPKYICMQCNCKVSEIEVFRQNSHKGRRKLLSLIKKNHLEESEKEIEVLSEDSMDLHLESSSNDDNISLDECDTADMGGVSRCSISERIGLKQHHGGIKMEQVEEANEGEFLEEYGDEEGKAEFETPKKASLGLLSPQMTVSSVPDYLRVSGEVNTEAAWHNQEHRVVDVQTVKGSWETWNLERCEMPLIQKECIDKANEESSVIANGGFDNNEENREECRNKETNIYKGRLRNKLSNINEKLADRYRKSNGKDCRRISSNNVYKKKPLEKNNLGDTIACTASKKNTKLKSVFKKTVDKPVFISKGSKSLSNKSKSELQNFFCDTCKKGFHCKYHLGCHVRIHNGVRPYKCSVCHKSFLQKGHLLQHNSVHTVVGKHHVCTECGKSFKYEYNLKLHIKLHRDHYPFPCVTCGKLFKSSITFHDHLKIHGIVKPFSCNICKKYFSRKDNLLKHQKTHEVNRNKQFSCHICKSSFALKHHLKKHMYSHDNFKRYKCSICGKGFPFPVNLQRHMTCHSTERHFKCPNCCICVKFKEDLKRHMKFFCKKM